MSKELSAEEFFKEIIPLLKQEVNRFYDNWVQSHTPKQQAENPDTFLHNLAEKKLFEQADNKPQPQKEEQRNEIKIIKGKAYTQEEVDKIEEMAFLSSRNGINSNNIEGAQYPTYKDYKQTLKK